MIAVNNVLKFDLGIGDLGGGLRAESSEQRAEELSDWRRKGVACLGEIDRETERLGITPRR